tara:strand:- start:652 stop:1878 length:1227 start_codon:yes stop_codon:yes gene_type:complete
MENLLLNFENKAPEIVFEWNDKETNAKGWLVINSLRGGAAAGGTRIRKDLSKEEVLALAKTMEVKFTVAGPSIGGGKSGINFDPRDPRKKGVLKRWFKAVRPILKSYYGTGGDMNVDEVEEVIPMCQELNILFPLEGVVKGHYKKDNFKTENILNQLTTGVPLVVTNKKFTPSIEKKYTVGDLITGFGVAESIIHYYKIYQKKIKDKRAIIQGWGNVAGAAAYFLSNAGVKIVGIIDKTGGVINNDGFCKEEVKSMLLNRSSNFLNVKNMLTFEEINNKIWEIKSEIFVPAAASRLVEKSHLENMINNNLEVISCGANVPFADSEIFYGPISKIADQNVSVIPDFIANCGMARAFSYFMQENIEIKDIAIFTEVSKTIENALREVFDASKKTTNISKTALNIALKKLI